MFVVERCIYRLNISLIFLEVTKWLIKHPVYTRFLSTENGYVVTKSQNDGSGGGGDSYAMASHHDHIRKMITD